MKGVVSKGFEPLKMLSEQYPLWVNDLQILRLVAVIYVTNILEFGQKLGIKKQKDISLTLRE